MSFSYDTANRRSTLTLSNGVNMSYTYDNDSRVTGITYKFHANMLGNLTYSYDSLGRRTQMGGSFAQTGLPNASCAPQGLERSAIPGHHSNLADANVLQQLNYTYDPVGNITEIYDEAFVPAFFQNQKIEPHAQ